MSHAPIQCSLNADGNGLCARPATACDGPTGSIELTGADTIRVIDAGGSSGTASSDGEQTVRQYQRDNTTGAETALGYGCAGPSVPGSPEVAGTLVPVVITVTREDFASLPIQPLDAHAGPPRGWIPVTMDVVLHADGESQLLETELLDTPVAIRATPVSYSWDMGDGNIIETTSPGAPYPSDDVTAAYTYDGWYDITLTTTFEGEFSVDGGEWQTIDGTVDVASDPIPLYSKSLESRLVNGDVPADDDRDPLIPERTADTEGPPDPDATTTTR